MYVPSPETVAVPTVVPPLVQSVGAEDCGPNTSNVTVPLAELPDDRVPDTDDGEIALPTVPLADADADRFGVATTVAVTAALV